MRKQSVIKLGNLQRWKGTVREYLLFFIICNRLQKYIFAVNIYHSFIRLRFENDQHFGLAYEKADFYACHSLLDFLCTC